MVKRANHAKPPNTRPTASAKALGYTVVVQRLAEANQASIPDEDVPGGVLILHVFETQGSEDDERFAPPSAITVMSIFVADDVAHNAHTSTNTAVTIFR